MARFRIPGVGLALDSKNDFSGGEGAVEATTYELHKFRELLNTNVMNFISSRASAHVLAAMPSRRHKMADVYIARLSTIIDLQIVKGLAIICAVDDVTVRGTSPYRVVSDDRLRQALREVFLTLRPDLDPKRLRLKVRQAEAWLDSVVYELTLDFFGGRYREPRTDRVKSSSSNPAQERKRAPTAINTVFAEGGIWLSTPRGQPFTHAFAGKGKNEIALSWPREQDESPLVDYFEELEAEAPSAFRKVSSFYDDRAIVEEIGGEDNTDEKLITHNLRAEWTSALSVLIEFRPTHGRRNAQWQTIWFTQSSPILLGEAGVSIDQRSLSANVERIGKLIGDTHKDARSPRLFREGYLQRVLLSMVERSISAQDVEN